VFNRFGISIQIVEGEWVQELTPPKQPAIRLGELCFRANTAPVFADYRNLLRDD
jgi:hypothetical protein